MSPSPRPQTPDDAPQRPSSADDELFGPEAYDEMLEGVCTAYLGRPESCALTCAERCAGEDELLRWAAQHDGHVRVAREHAITAARATQLAALARAAIFLGDWTADLTDLTSRLPH